MINKDWDSVLEEEYKKDYFKKLRLSIKNEYQQKRIYPEYSNIFAAFNLTKYDEVKIVILGQDPYHGENEAHGLSFSVREGVKIPPSLLNIFKELYSDLGIKMSTTDLTGWAKQGVLLLNSILTVQKDSPSSHKNIGWEEFTDSVIKKINEKDIPVVFILWGNFARGKKKYITNPKHLIIESPHPSPFSANSGFFGSKPFSKTNDFLIKNNMNPINWNIEI